MKPDLTEKIQAMKDKAKHTLKETGDKVRQNSEKAKDATERKTDRVDREINKDSNPDTTPPAGIYY